MDFETLIETHGLWLLWLGCAIEGEAVAVAGGVLEHRGVFGFWPVIAAVAAGGWTSDLLVYAGGRAFRGHPRVTRFTGHPRTVRLTGRLLRRPALLAAVFRFVPGARTVTPLALATASDLPAVAYAAITLVAAVVWALLAVSMGHGVGVLLAALFGHLSELDAVTLGAAAGLGLAALLWVWHRRRRART